MQIIFSGETRCCFVPVHHVPELFDVVRAAVLEFQVVSVFPHVQTRDREAGSAGNGFTHQRGIPVCGRNHSQFVAFQHQPRPAGAETSCCCFFEFSFEVVNGTEVTLDSRFQIALQSGAFFSPFQNRLWLAWPPALLRSTVFLSAGTGPV